MLRSQEDPEDTLMMDTSEDPVEDAREPDGSGFLDSFYGITSSNPVERAKAGRMLLYHAVLGPDANPKDAAYAFRRLLSGLCSGRASARQGNGAVLASFLKLHQDFERVREELPSEPEESTMSNLQFVRHRLCKATELEPNGTNGRSGRKGSEERDHQFGRLFGINSIVRSGILRKSQEEGTILQIARDLVDIYHQKKWLREPSAHAICMMLQSFEDSAIVDTIISQVIVPKLLIKGDVENREGPLECYSAEQIALTLFIQSRCPSGTPLPAPLNVPIVSNLSLPQIALALSETSNVVQPRIHLVWDVLWIYISSDPNQRQPRKVQTRRLKPDCDGTSTESLLQSLFKHVVYEQLLGLEESTGQVKTTHERRALVMSIVRSMAGIEFVSALQGRTRLLLVPNMLCNLVLNTLMVQKVFIEVICAGSGRQKNAHMLKPMALQILSELTNTLTDSRDDDAYKTRFAVAQALLTCDPRFDNRTKTNTVDDLLKLEDMEDELSAKLLWNEHIAFLQSQVTVSRANEPSLRELQANRALGFLESIFHLAKHFSRLLSSENEKHSYVQAYFDDILSYFMGIAFFDCSKVKSSAKERKGGNKSSSLRETISKINMGSAGQPFPIEVRTVASARFFSLVADRVAAEAHSGKYKEESAFAFLQSVWALHENYLHLDAISLKNTELDETDEEGQSIASALAEIVKLGSDTKPHGAESRWSCSCKTLAYVLRLLFLSCGAGSAEPTAVGDFDADDEAEDHEEISDLILDILRLMKLFSANTLSSDDEDPMVLLSMVCCTSLTSAFGSGSKSRGASPTLLRESVKLLWTNGLSIAASKNFVLDDNCISLLLDAIGAVSTGEEMDVDGHDGEEDSDGGESDGNDSPPIQEGSNSFMELDHYDNDEDIVVDETRLQSMLEEDSDIDVDENVLEHHEGADAALAKLIQTKQEARKAGQVARERSILAQQTRIMTLFECLVVGKPETWGDLLNFKIVLRIANALLHYRNVLTKSLEKSPRNIVGEKRSFAGRLSVLLKTKILKTRMHGLSIDEYAAGSFSPIKDEVLKCIRNAVNREQRQLCFQVLLFALKNLANDQQPKEASDVFGSLVNDWATNRSSKIDGVDFEQCIHHSPVLAQTSLSLALAKAGSVARSSFLKAESFRLLGMLYNPKLNAKETPLERQALECMDRVTNTFLQTLRTSLEIEPDMKKTKRIREVLRVVEKCIAFLMHYETAGDHKPILDALSSVLQQLDPESQAVTDAVKRICEQIESVDAKMTVTDSTTCQKVKKGSKKKKKKSKR